jgi:putative tryptophan/tyrosine transport system substrate-binding protein
MRRRDFILFALLGGIIPAWPLMSRTQQLDRLWRIGVLMSLDETDPETHARVIAFTQSLHELGWTDRNVEIHFRWISGDPNRAQSFAKELVELQPDVIVGASNVNVTALVQNTSTIPIVFVAVGDPIASGFVASWARPGGNVTGVSNFWPSMGGKWLEILKKIAPNVARVGFIANPATMPPARYFRWIEAAASQFAIGPIAVLVHDASKIEEALAVLAREPNGGLIVPPDPFTIRHRKLIIELAARYRLPTVYPYSYYAKDGGLLSYGVDPIDEYRQAAAYVDRILRGARPADLAIQHPAKYELVINLKTARALGLDVPRALLVRANEVIE